MPTVDITINGRAHSIGCGEGEQLRVKRLAQYVDSRVREQAAAHGQLGDVKLLLLTGLLIADELDDALSEIKRLKERVAAPAPVEAVNGEAREIAETTRLIERLATRVDDLAASLEKA